MFFVSGSLLHEISSYLIWYCSATFSASSRVTSRSKSLLLPTRTCARQNSAVREVKEALRGDRGKLKAHQLERKFPPELLPDLRCALVSIRKGL